MKNIIQQSIKANKIYFLICLIFIATASIVLILSYKDALHLYFNEFHFGFGDHFFKYLTYLGGGVGIGAFALYTLLKSYRFFIITLVSAIAYTGIVHLFKRVLIEDNFRPSKYFKIRDIELYIVEGEKPKGSMSFISGHTTEIFCVTTLFILMHKLSPLLQVIIAGIALLTAYSRIYLNQHFLSDVTAGAFVGIIIPLIINSLISKNNPKLNKGLLR